MLSARVSHTSQTLPALFFRTCANRAPLFGLRLCSQPIPTSTNTPSSYLQKRTYASNPGKSTNTNTNTNTKTKREREEEYLAKYTKSNAAFKDECEEDEHDEGDEGEEEEELDLENMEEHWKDIHLAIKANQDEQALEKIQPILGRDQELEVQWIQFLGAVKVILGNKKFATDDIEELNAMRQTLYSMPFVEFARYKSSYMTATDAETQSRGYYLLALLSSPDPLPWLEKSIAIDPNNWDAKTRVIITLMVKQKFNEALEEVNKYLHAIQQFPSSSLTAHLLLLRASIYYSIKRYVHAEVDFQKVIVLAGQLNITVLPSNAATLFFSWTDDVADLPRGLIQDEEPLRDVLENIYAMRAINAMKMEKLQEASSYLAKSENEDVLLPLIANILFMVQSSNVREAKKIFAEQFDESIDRWNMANDLKEYIQTGQIYKFFRHNAEALKCFNSAFKHYKFSEENFMRLLTMRAETCLDLYNETKKVDHLELGRLDCIAIINNGKSKHIHGLLIDILEKLGDYKAIVNWVNKLQAQVDKNNKDTHFKEIVDSYYYDKGVALKSLKFYSAAKEAFTYFLDNVYGGDEETRTARADIHFKLREYKQCLADYNELLGRNVTLQLENDMWYQKAFSEFSLGMLDDCYDTLMHCLNMGITFPDLLISVVLQMGTVIESTMQQLNDILASPNLAPKQKAKMLECRALLLTRMDKHEAAEVDFKNAFQADPNLMHKLRFEYAESLFRMNKGQQAVEFLKTFVNTNHEDQELWDTIIVNQVRLLQFADAIDSSLKSAKPLSEFVQRHVGQAYLFSMKYAEALPFFNRFISYAEHVQREFLSQNEAPPKQNQEIGENGYVEDKIVSEETRKQNDKKAAEFSIVNIEACKILRAYCYVGLGDIENARKDLKSVAHSERIVADAILKLVEARSKGGEIPASELEKSLPKFALLIRKATAFRAAQCFQDAVDTFTEALSIHFINSFPFSRYKTTVLVDRATCYQAMGNHEAAIKDCNSAMTILPVAREIFFVLLHSLAQLGKFTTLNDVLTNLTSLTDFSNPELAEIQIFMIAAFCKSYNFDQLAYDTMKKSPQIARLDSKRLLYQTSLVLRKYDEVLLYSTDIIKLSDNPFDRADALLSRCEARFMELTTKSDRGGEVTNKEWGEVLKDSEEALYINPQESARATWFRARVLQNLQQYTEAIELYETLVPVFSHQAYQGIAECLIAIEQPTMALKKLQECFLLFHANNPAPPYAFLLRARVNAILHNYQDAIADFTEYINLEQSDLFASVNAYAERAEVHAAVKKREDCESDLQKVQQLSEQGGFDTSLYESTKQKCEKMLSEE